MYPRAAALFGSVREIVHDPQHRPVGNASVQIKSVNSDWSQTAQTNDDGEFSVSAIPFGDYTVIVTASGFSATKQFITLASDTSQVLHFMLSLAPVSQTTVVQSDMASSAVETFTPTTLIDREDILRTPGADLTNSLAMITDFTPAAYMTRHAPYAWRAPDLLAHRRRSDPRHQHRHEPGPAGQSSRHRRHGNSPRQLQRAVRRPHLRHVQHPPKVRLRHEQHRRAGQRPSAASIETDDQIEPRRAATAAKFAYYASLNGNRSNLGLKTPVVQVLHDAENGFGRIHVADVQRRTEGSAALRRTVAPRLLSRFPTIRMRMTTVSDVTAQ